MNRTLQLEDWQWKQLDNMGLAWNAGSLQIGVGWLRPETTPLPLMNWYG
ncbi:hypothetical protein P7H25_08680 [Paenibacillus larvae]|nr:hypothetical protein [Paenibacillus larvae]MDT2255696.1 hypothetical protein [Paenibacillus larvae]